MTEQEMMLLVPQKLREMEEQYQIKILFAAESGSRSWRTAAPDADFDVRFVYVRKAEDYLRLESTRDVLEFPIEDQWDMNGWDLDKTLRLLHGANPRIFEWAHSPIVYMGREFLARFEPVLQEYFSAKKALYHYLNMAKQQKEQFLQGEEVKLKKYLYAIHPLMAAGWVLEKGTPPPVVFRELMDAQLPSRIKSDVEALVEMKVNCPEQKMIPRQAVLDGFINEEIDRISESAGGIPEETKSWESLNSFFLSELKQLEEKK